MDFHEMVKTALQYEEVGVRQNARGYALSVWYGVKDDDNGDESLWVVDYDGDGTARRVQEVGTTDAVCG